MFIGNKLTKTTDFNLIMYSAPSFYLSN